MKKVPAKAMAKYKAFHGKAPSRLTKRKALDLSVLVELASPEFITYKSTKKNGGGNGKVNFFKHKFDKKTKIYSSMDGHALVILGPKVKVTNRGIHG